MKKSIFRTVALYLLIQLCFIGILGTVNNVDFATIMAYGASSLVLHIALYLFLVGFRKEFYNISTDSTLTKINTANRITLLRISALPSIAFLLGNREIVEIRTILPIMLILVFLTDSFDGQIARRRKQITRIGQMLDSISDYSLLAVLSIVFFANQIVPRWFFYIIFFRLFLQALGMLVFIILKKPLPLSSTWGGKITIATTMVLYVLEVVRLFLPATTAPLFQVLEYVSGATIFLLSFEKAFLFFVQGKKLSKPQAAGEAI
ncbi:MAG TPA: CDP-alcohol phosphatidyltransferase family protein [Treponemataceae bacterium]|nr:CDP-alcohol phosphatidyltransferase family protein [Treponemataceae bacterium]